MAVNISHLREIMINSFHNIIKNKNCTLKKRSFIIKLDKISSS